MYVVAYETQVFKIKVLSDMRCLVMFVTMVCLLFLLRVCLSEQNIGLEHVKVDDFIENFNLCDFLE